MNKAFMTFSGSPMDGCELVYAETANKARNMSAGGNFDWDYTDINAHRKPEYDKYCDKPCVIECNDDLPKGAPLFFRDFGYDE